MLVLIFTLVYRDKKKSLLTFIIIFRWNACWRFVRFRLVLTFEKCSVLRSQGKPNLELRSIRYSGPRRPLGDVISASSFFCCIYVGVENKMITEERLLKSCRKVIAVGSRVHQPSASRMKNCRFSFVTTPSRRGPNSIRNQPPFEFKFLRFSLRSLLTSFCTTNS